MNDRGRVEVRTDFFLLMPADPGRGNGRLLYDVANRGNKVALGSFNGGGGNDPATLEHAGDGFLMEEGYSVLWSGVERGTWSPATTGSRSVCRSRGTRTEARSSGASTRRSRRPSTGLYVENVLEPGGDAATRRFYSLPFDWGSSRPYPSIAKDKHQCDAGEAAAPRRGGGRDSAGSVALRAHGGRRGRTRPEPGLRGGRVRAGVALRPGVRREGPPGHRAGTRGNSGRHLVFPIRVRRRGAARQPAGRDDRVRLRLRRIAVRSLPASLRVRGVQCGPRRAACP